MSIERSDKATILGRLRTRIISSSFIKSVLTLSSGAVVGQAINFIGMPVIGRIYAPAAIGDFTLVTANSGVIASVACLGMMTAFMLPESDDESRGLCRLATATTVAITSLVVLLSWLVSDWILIFTTEDAPYPLSLAVLWSYTILSTVSGICCAYANRKKLYRVMFWNPILTAGVNVGVGVALGLLNPGFIEYTAAHLLSFTASIVLFIAFANPYSRIENPDNRNPIRLLSRYRQFPFFQMPANLVSSLSDQIPAMLFSTVYSAATLGMYSMAMKVLSLPSTLIATPVNRVFYQEACERYNDGRNVGEFAFSILKANVKIALAPICVLIVFGEWIFAIFLGEQWGEAGLYASVLGLYQLMLFCNSCLSGDFTIIRKNHLNLASAATKLAVSIIVFVVFSLLVDASPLACLATLSASMTLVIIAFQGLFLRLTGVGIWRYFSFVALFVIVPFGCSYGLGALLQVVLH